MMILFLVALFAAFKHCRNLLAESQIRLAQTKVYFSFAKYKPRIKEIYNEIGIDYKIVLKELKV
jgi:hypothetical protein